MTNPKGKSKHWHDADEAFTVWYGLETDINTRTHFVGPGQQLRPDEKRQAPTSLASLNVMGRGTDGR